MQKHEYSLLKTGGKFGGIQRSDLTPGASALISVRKYHRKMVVGVVIRNVPDEVLRGSIWMGMATEVSFDFAKFGKGLLSAIVGRRSLVTNPIPIIVGVSTFFFFLQLTVDSTVR